MYKGIILAVHNFLFDSYMIQISKEQYIKVTKHQWSLFFNCTPSEAVGQFMTLEWYKVGDYTKNGQLVSIKEKLIKSVQLEEVTPEWINLMMQKLDSAHAGYLKLEMENERLRDKNDELAVANHTLTNEGYTLRQSIHQLEAQEFQLRRQLEQRAEELFEAKEKIFAQQHTIDVTMPELEKFYIQKQYGLMTERDALREENHILKQALLNLHAEVKGLRNINAVLQEGIDNAAGLTPFDFFTETILLRVEL